MWTHRWGQVSEAWKDEGEFEQRTQLKLGEALKDRMILATALN